MAPYKRIATTHARLDSTGSERGGNNDGRWRENDYLPTYYRSIGSSWQGHLQDRAIYDAVNEGERQEDVAAQGPAEVHDTPTFKHAERIVAVQRLEGIE